MKIFELIPPDDSVNFIYKQITGTLKLWTGTCHMRVRKYLVFSTTWALVSRVALMEPFLWEIPVSQSAKWSVFGCYHSQIFLICNLQAWDQSFVNCLYICLVTDQDSEIWNAKFEFRVRKKCKLWTFSIMMVIAVKLAKLFEKHARLSVYAKIPPQFVIVMHSTIHNVHW